jgi:hypothetical protein
VLASQRDGGECTQRKVDHDTEAVGCVPGVLSATRKLGTRFVVCDKSPYHSLRADSFVPITPRLLF